MRKFFDYILFGFLVCITLTIFFVSRVNAITMNDGSSSYSIKIVYPIQYVHSGNESYSESESYNLYFSSGIYNTSLYPNITSWRASFSGTYYPTTYDYFDLGPKFSYHQGSNTDNNGNVEFYVSQETTGFIDFYVDKGYVCSSNDNYCRYSFMLSVVGSSQTQINNLMANYIFEPVGETNCSYKYSSDYGIANFYFDCSSFESGSISYFRLKNNVPYYRPNNSTSYDIYTNLYVSKLVGVSGNSWNSISHIEDNPYGDKYDSDYTKIETYSDSFFSGFSTSNYNGLTRVIASPLYLIEGLQAYSTSPINFSIFGKTISLPTGATLLWQKPTSRFSNISIGNYTCNKTCAKNLVTNFQSFVGNVFTMWFVYISIKHLLKVLFGLLDPTSDNVEVF